MVFQYFYICGTGKRKNIRIDWGFKRQTKKKTITKINRSRRGEKAVKKFKLIHSFIINIKSYKHRCLLILPNLVVKTLVRSDILSKKDIRMYFRNHVVKATGKKHK